MVKIWEIFYPYILALSLSTIIFISNWEITDIKYFESILNAIVTFSSIVIAFLGTTITILITLTNSKVMQKIKEHGAQDTLTSYLTQTIIVGVGLAIYSMILFMFVDYEGVFANILLVVFVFLLSLLFFLFWRIMYINSKLLGAVLNERENGEENLTTKAKFKPTINR